MDRRASRYLRFLAGWFILVAACQATTHPADVTAKQPKPAASSEATRSGSAARGETYRFATDVPDQSMSFTLDVRIAGKRTEEAWRQFCEKLFGYFDRNADGRLDAREAAACPSVTTLRRQVRGDFLNSDSTERARESTERLAVEGLTADAFAERALRLGMARSELIARPSPTGFDVRLHRRLFDLLAGEAGVLRRESFVTAVATLARYDADGDERVSFAELSVDRNRRPAADEPSAIVRFQRDDDPPTKTLPLPVYVGYTRREVERGGDVRLNNGVLTAYVGPDAGPDTPAGGGLIVKDGILIWYSGEIATPGKPAGGAEFRSARAELEQQWETDDADADGTLSDAELRFSPLADAWHALGKVAANSDGKRGLPKEQWTKYLDVLNEVADLWVEARWQDHGRQLASFLDRDGDRALSPRELAHGWEIFKGVKPQASVRWGRVTRLVAIHFSQGAPTAENTTADEGAAKAGSIRAAAPKWFTAMDRNGDGDVSPREFLGTAADFKGLDADADGLIGTEEAR